jgi:hypothetical protein
MNTDIDGAEFILDVDGDTSITADTDDQIDFKAGGTDTLHVTNGKVGVGIAAAARTFHVHDDTQPYIHMSNNTTGTATSDGFDILVDNSSGKVILNQRENQPIEFYVNNTESLQLETDGDLTFVRAGTGVHLGVTSATASNLLDDYEEGTFTPTVSVGNLGSDSNGHYTKVGRLVTFTLLADALDNTSSSADILIQSLPFTSLNSAESSAHAVVACKNVNKSNLTLVAQIAVNGTQMEIKSNGAGGTSSGQAGIRYSDMGSNGAFKISGHYYTG